MKKKTWLGVGIALTLYMVLLGLLTAAETAYGASGIRNFADALWYSVVTLTTVGYGDMYPVSPLGKVIGVFFLLLSMGFLAFLLGTMYSLFSGHLWPAILLRIKRKRSWYLFSEINPASVALARDLEHQHPDSLMIFCSVSRGDAVQRRRNRLFLPEGIVEISKRFKMYSGKRTAFLISENELKNRDEAYALRETGIELYCCSDEAVEKTRISYFDPYECCARQYWKIHPLHSFERCVLLVGDGDYARALLNSAVIANCRAPFITAQYHMFGNWQDYLNDHFCLEQALAIGHVDAQRDALFFHNSPWNADPELIARADRILFCSDDESENANCVQRLVHCFAHHAELYVRTSHQIVKGTRFGNAAEIFTSELVKKRRLDHTAEQLHGLYSESVSGTILAWNELDAFNKSSIRAATDHIPAKISFLTRNNAVAERSLDHAVRIYKAADAACIEMCRQIEHERWLRFRSLHNWQYAPVRDNAARKHPRILPYEQVSDADKAKYDLSWMQLEHLK